MKLEYPLLPKRKTQVIVIASRDDIYDQLINVYWIPLIQLVNRYYSERLIIKLIFGNDSKVDDLKIISNNIIISDTPETYIPGILQKTVHAFKIVAKQDCDYVLRTNLSSFFILDNLLKWIDDLPITNLYSGVIGNVDYISSPYASGAAFILSKDVLDYFINNIDNLKVDKPYHDDILIGDLLSNRYPPTSAKRLIIETLRTYNEGNINSMIPTIKSHYHIRIKNTFDRNIDVKIFQHLMNIFYKPTFNFITYGDDMYKVSRERIVKEALEFGFDTAIAYKPEDFSSEFAETFKDVLKQPRGGGYWIWKWHFILRRLNEIKYGDYLCYLDAGCTISMKGKNR